MKHRNTRKKQSKRNNRHGHPSTGRRSWNPKRQSRPPSPNCQRRWWTYVPWGAVWHGLHWLWDKLPLLWQALREALDWMGTIS